jgi:hypothetical protein
VVVVRVVGVGVGGQGWVIVVGRSSGGGGEKSNDGEDASNKRRARCTRVDKNRTGVVAAKK